jgi:hypothetical protein
MPKNDYTDPELPFRGYKHVFSAWTENLIGCKSGSEKSPAKCDES